MYISVASVSCQGCDVLLPGQSSSQAQVTDCLGLYLYLFSTGSASCCCCAAGTLTTSASCQTAGRPLMSSWPSSTPSMELCWPCPAYSTHLWTATPSSTLWPRGVALKGCPAPGQASCNVSNPHAIRVTTANTPLMYIMVQRWRFCDSSCMNFDGVAVC